MEQSKEKNLGKFDFERIAFGRANAHSSAGGAWYLKELEAGPEDRIGNPE